MVKLICKLIMEKLFINANKYSISLNFLCVINGNVAWSTGLLVQILETNV